jgi:hypothetical protein
MIDRGIRKVIQRDGDFCSLCRAAFQHNGKTYYGTAYSGTVVCVGECCVGKLRTVEAAGLYCSADRPHELPPPANAEALSPEEVIEGVEAYQQYIAMADKLAADAGKRAGLPEGAPVAVFLSDNAWKDDDRLWFEAHSDRSHRLRRPFAGEKYYRGDRPPIAPPRHESQILVRQLQPGMRIRASFIRNLAIDIPDYEPILHALFDVVSSGRTTTISVEEVAALAEKYRADGSRTQ